MLCCSRNTAFLAALTFPSLLLNLQQPAKRLQQYWSLSALLQELVRVPATCLQAIIDADGSLRDVSQLDMQPATLLQLELRAQLLLLGETVLKLQKASQRQPANSSQSIDPAAASAFMAEIDVSCIRHCVTGSGCRALTAQGSLILLLCWGHQPCSIPFWRSWTALWRLPCFCSNWPCATEACAFCRRWPGRWTAYSRGGTGATLPGLLVCCGQSATAQLLNNMTSSRRVARSAWRSTARWTCSS